MRLREIVRNREIDRPKKKTEIKSRPPQTARERHIEREF